MHQKENKEIQIKYCACKSDTVLRFILPEPDTSQRETIARTLNSCTLIIEAAANLLGLELMVTYSFI